MERNDQLTCSHLTEIIVVCFYGFIQIFWVICFLETNDMYNIDKWYIEEEQEKKVEL